MSAFDFFTNMRRLFKRETFLKACGKLLDIEVAFFMGAIEAILILKKHFN